MSTNPNENSSEDSRFSHITVGQTTPSHRSDASHYDDEEVFDIGGSRGSSNTGQSGSAGYEEDNGVWGTAQQAAPQGHSADSAHSTRRAQPQQRSRRSQEDDSAARRRSRTEERDAGERRADDEDPDYGLDDLPPMSLMQKIILFALIVIVVVVAAYLFSYFMGVSLF